jgi:hypothetical protein
MLAAILEDEEKNTSRRKKGQNKTPTPNGCGGKFQHGKG